MSNHNACVYRGTEEFFSAVGGFVRAGLSAGDHVLVIAQEQKLARLRRELGSVSGNLELWDSESAYRHQGRIFQLTVDYVHDLAGRTRVVAEQDLAARSDLEVEAYMCAESAANAVYRDLPLTVLCPYDASALPAHVVDTCRQTHGGLLQGDRMVDNPRYLEPADFLTRRCTASAPPASAETFTCETPDDLSAARRLVAAAARRGGLGMQLVDELVIAANEVLTNALTHGRPPARLHLYRQGSVVVCHVRDQGPGIEDPLAGYLPPPEELPSGRGLMVARQLCDSVEITTDETGTHVRLLMLPRN